MSYRRTVDGSLLNGFRDKKYTVGAHKPFHPIPQTHSKKKTNYMDDFQADHLSFTFSVTNVVSSFQNISNFNVDLSSNHILVKGNILQTGRL